MKTGTEIFFEALAKTAGFYQPTPTKSGEGFWKRTGGPKLKNPTGSVKGSLHKKVLSTKATPGGWTVKFK